MRPIKAELSSNILLNISKTIYDEIQKIIIPLLSLKHKFENINVSTLKNIY